MLGWRGSQGTAGKLVRVTRMDVDVDMDVKYLFAHGIWRCSNFDACRDDGHFGMLYRE